MSHVGNFVIARYFSSLPPPFHAFPRLYTELFSFPLPPKTSLPHESRTWLYLRICTRNIKSPRVYTRSLSFAYDTLSSACPFSPFLFFSSSFPCSSIHLARFRPSYSLVISSSDTVRSLFMGALPILYISDLWAGKYRFPFT